MRALARVLRPEMRLFPGGRGHQRGEGDIAATLTGTMPGRGNTGNTWGIGRGEGRKEKTSGAA